MRISLFLLMAALMAAAYCENVTSYSFGDADTCWPNFVDNLTVQVTNLDMLPLEGIGVSVHYQYSKSFGNVYYDTAYTPTDRNGMMHVTVANREPKKDSVDCDLKITAKHDTALASTTVKATSHAGVIVLPIDLKLLNVHITDSYGKPIKGARVYANSMNATTDFSGRAAFLVGAGTVKVSAVFGEGVQEESVAVSAEDKKKDMTISVPVFDVEFKVVDHTGKPLDAAITIGKKTERTDGNGTARFYNISAYVPVVKATYNGIAKEIQPDFFSSKKETVIFDMSPPDIASVDVLQGKATTKLVMGIEDGGTHASGIDAGGITVQYSYGGKTWESAPVYLSGKNQFTADIPKTEHDGFVDFVIYAKDRDGNVQKLEGQFLSKAGPVANGTQDGPAVPDLPEVPSAPAKEDGLPIIPMAIGAAVLIGLFLIYRMKFAKPKGPEQPAEPEAPKFRLTGPEGPKPEAP